MTLAKPFLYQPKSSAYKALYEAFNSKLIYVEKDRQTSAHPGEMQATFLS